MILQRNRFHGHGSLRYVYQHGKTVRGPLTAIKFVRNDKRRDYRLAIVTSKKVSKSAVTRNRIRRRLYEEFRKQSSSFKQPYDMVVTVFNDQPATLPADQISKLVHAQLKEANII
jgi:ribonuclease P protein component